MMNICLIERDILDLFILQNNMTLSKNSLGGQNTGRRATGADSISASSVNLFKRLRELDRKITELDKTIKLRSFGYIYFEKNILVLKRNIENIISIPKSEWNKLINRRIKLDNKRKEVRNKRKKFNRDKNNGNPI